jgi:phage tail-like protein
MRPDAPRAASARAVLRDGLPEVFRADDFAMRFAGALEEVLDPIVATLDALSAQFDPALAAPDVLDLLAGWLGFELDERSPIARRRLFLAHAAELARRQGTRAGLELALHISFPGLPFDVEDHGGVTFASRAEDLPPRGRPEVVVRCRAAAGRELAADIARVIEQFIPAHVRYRLHVPAEASG